MARNNDGSSPSKINPACPVHSRAGKVEWAGLPINLDLAFSQKQRDKVYAQHLRLRRGTRLDREASELCSCDMADYADLGSKERRSVSGW